MSDKKNREDVLMQIIFNDKNIKDRFFLEEIYKRFLNGETEYVDTLLKDWLLEMVEDDPLSEKQRKAYIKNTGQKDFYFKSEKDLLEILK